MLVTPSLYGNGQTGLVGTLGLTIINPGDDSTLLAHTTTGIVENPAGSSTYYWRGTIADSSSYIAVWDVSGTIVVAEEVVAPTIVGAAITSPVNGVTGPGTVFVIKRGDSAPSITYQAKRVDGSPVDISGSTILFKMRLVPDVGSIVVNRSAGITDGPTGLMRYNWQHSGADTATAGEYDAEFQVTFPDGSVETFPATDPDVDAVHEYITVKIPKDLD